MSRVRESVRQAYIDDIARPYAVKMEECPKSHAMHAQQHKSRRQSNFSPAFSAAIQNICMVSFMSSLHLSNRRQVSRDRISTISE